MDHGIDLIIEDDHMFSCINISLCEVPDHKGPALIAVWSKALPLTASFLSPLPGSNPEQGM